MLTFSEKYFNIASCLHYSYFCIAVKMLFNANKLCYILSTFILAYQTGLSAVSPVLEILILHWWGGGCKMTLIF